MSAEDIIAVQQLVCREREARDRGWWDEMRKAFSPTAAVDVSWYQGDAEGFITGSIRTAEEGGHAKHKLGPVVVRIVGSKALATVSASIEARTNIGGFDADLVSDVSLLYRGAKNAEGQWLVRYLTCIYVKDRLVPVFPGAVLALNISELRKYRPSYRFLSFVIESTGITINSELAGEDRPAEVKKVYSDSFRWLRGDEPEL